MEVKETTQVKVTLTPKEYALILAKARANGFKDASEVLKKAVIDFCMGGYTPDRDLNEDALETA